MKSNLYPLKFDPIFQYRIWGGRRLENVLSKDLPADERIGEAWILSDREDFSSVVTEGSLKGEKLTDLIKTYGKELMGELSEKFDRFPLLLKFLDCHAVLSVQVHPSDDQKEFIPKGDTGKTEAWVVLETADDSCIYTGLKKGTTKEDIQEALKNKTLANRLHSFVPKKDDAVLIKSGTVHTIGGTVVFEVQENSDVTFRLYDWDRIDEKTGKPRDLQIDKALACIDYDQVEVGPVIPQKSKKFPNDELLFDNEHFKVWRINSDKEFSVGFDNQPRVLVCLEGSGTVNFQDSEYHIKKGEVMLLAAAIGKLDFIPVGNVKMLQIAIPDESKMTAL